MYNFVLRSTTITHMQPFTGYEGVEFFSLVQINTLLTNGFGLFNKSDGVVRDRHVGRFVIFLKNRITLKSFFKAAGPRPEGPRKKRGPNGIHIGSKNGPNWSKNEPKRIQKGSKIV